MGCSRCSLPLGRGAILGPCRFLVGRKEWRQGKRERGETEGVGCRPSQSRRLTLGSRSRRPLRQGGLRWGCRAGSGFLVWFLVAECVRDRVIKTYCTDNDRKVCMDRKGTNLFTPSPKTFDNLPFHTQREWRFRTGVWSNNLGSGAIWSHVA